MRWSLCTGEVEFMYRSGGVYVQVRWSLSTGQVEFMYRLGGVMYRSDGAEFMYR